MVAYFVRRTIGGIGTWFVACFLFYSLLISPSLPMELPCNECHKPSLAWWQQIIRDNELDKPWPSNYLAWLFDPQKTEFLDPNENKLEPIGIDLDLIGFHIRGSGVLIGDFGHSVNLAKGRPVLAMYGVDLPRFFIFTLVPTFALMLIATLQRRGRPRIWTLTEPERPSRRFEPMRVLG
jgi:hypothetical protein